MQKVRFQNLQRIKSFLSQKLVEIVYEGIVGAAKFKRVYDELMPVQKVKLENFCGKQFYNLLKRGSIICIGIAYPEHVIDCIDNRSEDGTIDRDSWNIYAREYHKINRFLNSISEDIASFFGGIPVPATVEGITVESVEDYYGMTVSHKVVAENAGLGWRGKNELIVNEKFSCALRFASVITNLPLVYGKKAKTSCGKCEACLEACPFLRNKDRLENYRENCRKYISELGLDAEVCGKCIKACYRHSIFKENFSLK